MLSNPRHEKYVQELMRGKSQRQAYIAAFPNSAKWKEATVDSRASELYRTSKVLGRLEELQKEAESEAVINRRQRMEILSDMALNAEEKTDSRIKAIDTLNKMDGEYTTKLELSQNIDDTVKEMEDYFNAQRANITNALE